MEKTMAERRVKKSRKDNNGNITALCNPGEYWSPRQKSDAISDIETGNHSYYVEEAGYQSTVKVHQRNGSKYLRTDADATSKNNLDNLPDC